MFTVRFILGLSVLAIFALASAAPRPGPVYIEQRLEHDGVALDIRVEPFATEQAPEKPQIGQLVRLHIEATRLADRQPLSRWPVGVWLDRHVSVASGAVPVCGQRLAGLLSGNLMQRPLLDLTGYFVATLDAEGRVSVLDPGVDFTGRTSLFTTLALRGTPVDWVKTDDDTRLFVALRAPNGVAVIDTLSWQVRTQIPLPEAPTRLQLSPDQHLLWVGLYDSTQAPPPERSDAAPGAVVIDTSTDRPLATIALPSGHHEFALSDDGQRTFITARQSAQIVALDNSDFRTRTTRTLDGVPIDALFIAARRELWVADAKSGRIERFDALLNARGSIALEPGLGPMYLSPDGKSVLALNPSQHRVTIVDVLSARAEHSLTISGRPYDIAFSELYAYVRSLDSEQITLLSLATLRDAPYAQPIPIGQTPPSASPQLTSASTMAPSLSSTGLFIAAPADRAIYHFMEGMNAPDASVQTFGHTPIAVAVVSRGLREVERGRYSALLELPAAGRLVLALASESPRVRECLSLDVESPLAPKPPPSPLTWRSPPAQIVTVGEPLELRFEINTDAPALSSPPQVLLVSGAGGGVVRYRARVDRDSPRQFVVRARSPAPGGYYVYVLDAQRRLPALGAVPATVHVLATQSPPHSLEERTR